MDELGSGFGDVGVELHGIPMNPSFSALDFEFCEREASNSVVFKLGRVVICWCWGR